jgi:sigma-B regulation protein RsbQ
MLRLTRGHLLRKIGLTIIEARLSPGFMTVLERNHVKTFGNGTQPMLFAHGFGCDQNMWRFVEPAFRSDYKTVLFDYVGCGKSDVAQFHPERYATLHGYVKDVLEVCDALDLSQVVFVGHSVSAMVGILAAIEQPERFAKLILVGPSPCYMNDGDYVGGFKREDIEGLLRLLEENHLGWSRTMAPTIMGNPERPELGQELTESFCQMDPRVARRFAQTTFLTDHREDLPRLKTPSLVLQCSDDVIAPDVVGNYVHHHLAGSRFKKLRATGHCPNLSAPAETIAAMREFLRT